jgi:hypothetical protein
LSLREQADKEDEPILETLKKEIFSFGFYFSFDRDLTLQSEGYYQQRATATRRPTNSFLWNENMLNNMMEMANEKKCEWCIPVVQGYYGKFNVKVGEVDISYELICRRAKNRSGTRFYSRGIDENGNCSNFIET